jgi:hypothetical protein
MTVIMNNSEVAENLLKLHSLRAKINVKNMLKHMHLSPRSKEGRAAKKIFGDWVALGWISGAEEKGYLLSKGGLEQIKNFFKVEPWVDEAIELIEKYGELIPNIQWGEELELQSDWFKEARWPWLKDDRFYLRGINRKGMVKEVQPPVDGWRDGGAPIDWSPESN